MSASDDLLKAAERALAEVESLRRIKSLQAEEIDALQGKIRAMDELLRIERERGDAYKKANEERASANRLDSERVKLFEESLAQFKAEVERLRRERDSARRLGKVFAALGLIVGGGLVLLGRR